MLVWSKESITFGGIGVNTTRKVRVEDTQEVKIDQYLSVLNHLTKDESEKLSIVTAKLDGPHANRMNRRSAKLYFVTKGTLDVIVDEKIYSLGPNEMLLIPPGAWHKSNGKQSEIHIICAPAYDSEDEVVEE